MHVTKVISFLFLFFLFDSSFSSKLFIWMLKFYWNEKKKCVSRQMFLITTYDVVLWVLSTEYDYIILRETNNFDSTSTRVYFRSTNVFNIHVRTYVQSIAHTKRSKSKRRRKKLKIEYTTLLFIVNLFDLLKSKGIDSIRHVPFPHSVHMKFISQIY